MTNQPNATIAVGGSPQAIAIAGGRAWVTIDAQTIPSPARLRRRGTSRLAVRFRHHRSGAGLRPAVARCCTRPARSSSTTPTRPGRRGPARARGRAVAAGALGRRQDLHVHDPQRLSVLAAVDRAGHRPDVQAHDRAHPQPGNEEPRRHEFADIVGAGAYMAGKTAHIAGVTARANTLTIRLTDPAPNLPSRLAQFSFCAVPSNTPIERRGVIPSAGPYRVASFTPNQGVVLTRNPNYHGSRPHRLARIELAVGIPGPRAVAQVEAGTADYAIGRRRSTVPTPPRSPLATAHTARPRKAATSSTSSIPDPRSTSSR